MEKLDLHEHNRIAYEKVKEAFLTQDRCCVIHPTGTGKSFICYALMADHSDKSILYVTSYAKDLEQFEKKMYQYIENCDFIDTCLYSGLDRLSYKKYDYIILNEMHRAGAEDWEKSVQARLKQCPDAKVLGLTATAIRYLDNERDMAKELFDGNIVSEITLQDAILQSLLPVPHYITGVYSYEEDIRNAERKLQSRIGKKGYEDAKRVLEQARRKLELSGGIDRIFQEKMKKPHGKYLVFCRNFEHMQHMIEKSKEWFSWEDKEPHFYSVHSLKKEDSSFDDFLNDEDDTLRLLFCINMLNEGVHAPGIDGVICFRPTESMNVYLQQIGRALCTGNAEHPYIFDIVNNAESLTPVRGFWNEVIQRSQSTGNPLDKYFEVYSRDIELSEILNQFAILTAQTSWESYYEVCKQYAAEHGSLCMARDYQVNGIYPARWLATQRRRYAGKVKPPMTKNEIRLLNEIGIEWDPRDINGRWSYWYEELCRYKNEHGDLNVPGTLDSPYKPLYTWTNTQRYRKKGKEGYQPLTEEQILKLESIGFKWDVETRWDKAYHLAETYYKEYGNIDMKKTEKYHEFSLGAWVTRQKQQKDSLSEAQIEKLDNLQIDWDTAKAKTWEDILELLVSYKKKYGTINMLSTVKYKGYGIGYWISKMRTRYRKGLLTKKQIADLEALGIVWNTLPPTFDEMIAYAKTYYEDHGNLRVPYKYETEDGVKLGHWIGLQRRRYSGKVKDCQPFTKEQIKALESIGMEWSRQVPYETMYACAKEYYAVHGNLELSQKAIVNGLKLGSWVSDQKRKLRDPKRRKNLSAEKIHDLEEIGFSMET